MKRVILNVAAALSFVFAVSCACDTNKSTNSSEKVTTESTECEKSCEGAKECCKANGDSAKAECERLNPIEANLTEAQLDSLDIEEEMAFKPVEMPSVQLKPEQQKKLKEMLDGARAKVEAIKSLPREERSAARKALQQECAEFLNNLLDEDQLEAIRKK